MWNLLKKKSGQKCGSVRDSLEDAAVRNSNAGTVEELNASLPSSARAHINACAACREAAQDLVATKELFKDVASATEEARPWFAARVMAAIAAQERELAERVSAWSEFPRFASRLAWIAALLLLVATTWFYEKGMTRPSRATNGDASPESIFETPPPANQDDVLIGMVEMQP